MTQRKKAAKRKARTLYVVEVSYLGGWRPFHASLDMEHATIERDGIIERGERHTDRVRITEFREHLPAAKGKRKT